jgi:hypothetical protein
MKIRTSPREALRLRPGSISHDFLSPIYSLPATLDRGRGDPLSGTAKLQMIYLSPMTSHGTWFGVSGHRHFRVARGRQVGQQSGLVQEDRQPRLLCFRCLPVFFPGNVVEKSQCPGRDGACRRRWCRLSGAPPSSQRKLRYRSASHC